jgi:hypothetical protein
MFGAVELVLASVSSRPVLLSAGLFQNANHGCALLEAVGLRRARPRLPNFDQNSETKTLSSLSEELYPNAAVSKRGMHRDEANKTGSFAHRGLALRFH